MNKKILMAAVFLGFAVALYVFIEAPFSKKYIVTVDGASLEVELANTPHLRQKGLMGRQHLGENEGMLFIMAETDRHIFWMKNTLIPLSIAFIRDDGTIAEILDMEPDHWDGKLTEYRSFESVRFALEVNQGWFRRHHVNVRDKVHFSKSIKRHIP